jgi:3-hydroxybutyryl-CoA dehydratase
MQSPLLPNRFTAQPNIGDKISFRRTLTEADVALFIGVTWDVNPLHTDDVYVSALPTQRRIVPGLLTASLLTHLGGLWAFMATEMKFTFIEPVYIGDTITAEAEIVALDPSSGKVTLDCSCTNSEGSEVLQAEVVGYPGRFENAE